MSNLITSLNPGSVVKFLLSGSEKPKWLIEGLLPEGALEMMSGPRKVSKKTWTALDWNLTVALGATLYPSTLTTAHDGKRVLFVEEEGTAHDTRSRFLKLLRGKGIDPHSNACPENVLHKLDTNFYFMHHPRVKLDNPNWVAALCNFIKQEGISLVTLDAITYMTNGDENSKQEMAQVNDALFAFRQCGAAVLYLVHTNKQAQREDADPDLDVRGSSVLLDAYDAHFALRRHADDHINLLARYRDFDEQRYYVYWNFAEDAVVPELKPVTPELEQEEKLKDVILQLIPGVEYTPASLGKQLGVTSKEATKIIGDLARCNVLIPLPQGGFKRKDK